MLGLDITRNLQDQKNEMYVVQMIDWAKKKKWTHDCPQNPKKIFSL